MSKNNVRLKAIETIENKFSNRDEFLRWREQILKNYEQSIIEYKKEIDELMGNQSHKEQDS